jgi:hypothetical protein
MTAEAAEDTQRQWRKVSPRFVPGDATEGEIELTPDLESGLRAPISSPD